MNRKVFVIGMGTGATATIVRMFNKPTAAFITTEEQSMVRSNPAFTWDDFEDTSDQYKHESGDYHCKRNLVKGEEGHWTNNPVTWESFKNEFDDQYTDHDNNTLDIYMSSRNANLWPYIDTIKEDYPDSLIVLVHSNYTMHKIRTSLAGDPDMDQHNPIPGLLEERCEEIESYIANLTPTTVVSNATNDYIDPDGNYICNCEDPETHPENGMINDAGSIDYYII